MALAATKKEWTTCLAKSGGQFTKCSKLEKDLRAVSKSEGVDCCIDETVKLMMCTQGSGRSAGCSAEFLSMRECNRSSGRQLLSEGGAYAVAPGKAGLFSSSATSVVSSTAPPRTLQGMVDKGQELSASFGIAPGGVAF
mmetsp:Transcript_56351/g.132097  ORF Transcript_56351/g.132097 Transcript_56351/m.132097 type:complete len:139 (-) Transcript_56351:147-563(-)